MKIISKYKDYYDYLQGIYGVDNRLILDRTKGSAKNLPGHTGKHILVICGKVLEYVHFNNTNYFNEDIAQFNEKGKWSLYYLRVKPKYLINLDIIPKNHFNSDKIYYPTLSEDIHNIYPGLKELSKKCPIFIYHENSRTIWREFPCLLELGVNKQIEAKDMWIMLSEWLGNRITENEPVVPVGDDKVRILSAGFDLKTSFRH